MKEKKFTIHLGGKLQFSIPTSSFRFRFHFSLIRTKVTPLPNFRIATPYHPLRTPNLPLISRCDDSRELQAAQPYQSATQPGTIGTQSGFRIRQTSSSSDGPQRRQPDDGGRSSVAHACEASESSGKEARKARFYIPPTHKATPNCRNV